MPPLTEEPGRTQRAAPVIVAPHLGANISSHVETLGSETGASPNTAPHTEAYLIPPQPPGMLRRASVAALSAFGMGSRSNASDNGSVIVETVHPEDEYDSDMVDLLDVIGTPVQLLVDM
jgi:hypothetical protein